MAEGRVQVERVMVFLGVVIALAGATLLARGVDGLGAALSAPESGAGDALPALTGLLVLGSGVGLATTTRFGRPATLAALGVPFVALGLASLSFALGAGEPLQTLAVEGAAAPAAAESSLPLAVGILASMVGMTLLLVFGLKARSTRR